MPALQIEKVHGPARREIVKGLVAYNVAAVGKFDHRPLTVTIRERGKIGGKIVGGKILGGKILGGLVGETFFGWMFVSLLWVSERHRGNGWGSSLMRTAEAEARERGVHHVYLDSFSFQAPAFYEKLGYREFGRLKDFPAGYDRVWMTKAL
jgi:ribosomal protein S18 acetylase RimI-like enzyme